MTFYSILLQTFSPYRPPIISSTQTRESGAEHLLSSKELNLTMSRAYRIPIPEKCAVIEGNERFSPKLMPILPEEEMAALLTDALIEAGWTLVDEEASAGARQLRAEVAGQELLWDERSGEFIFAHQRVLKEGGAAHTYDDVSKESQDQAVERALQAQEQRLKKRQADEESAIAAITVELDEALQTLLGATLPALYRDALLKKARRLGEISELVESESASGAIEMKVTVKI